MDNGKSSWNDNQICKDFICKCFATRVIERIVILLLEELVKRTDSDIDDKIYKIVFEKTEMKKDRRV